VVVADPWSLVQRLFGRAPQLLSARQCGAVQAPQPAQPPIQCGGGAARNLAVRVQVDAAGASPYPPAPCILGLHGGRWRPTVRALPALRVCASVQDALHDHRCYAPGISVCPAVSSSNGNNGASDPAEFMFSRRLINRRSPVKVTRQGIGDRISMAFSRQTSRPPPYPEATQMTQLPGQQTSVDVGTRSRTDGTTDEMTRSNDNRLTLQTRPGEGVQTMVRSETCGPKTNMAREVATLTMSLAAATVANEPPPRFHLKHASVVRRPGATKKVLICILSREMRKVIDCLMF